MEQTPKALLGAAIITNKKKLPPPSPLFCLGGVPWELIIP
jgi:hypothetical protein